MNNKTFLAIAFLLAGTLLTAATTAMAPAYAGGDDYGDGKDGRDGDGKDSKYGAGNKQKVEDESAGALNDCDAVKNEFEDNTFDNINECIAIAATDESVVNDGNGDGDGGNGEEPETCEECFRNILTEDEIMAYLTEVNTPTLELLCESLLNDPEGIPLDVFESALFDAGIVDETTVSMLVQCLERAGVTFTTDG